ncbi:MAG: TonB family protein [Chitinophagales bacterium]|nr:TonB family protein [Chitinophagales bacterium]
MQIKEFDDIIFENRNKDYGAYQMRRKHDDNNLIGFLIASVIIFMVFAMPKIVEYLNSDSDQIPIETKREVKYSELSAPPPIEIERPPEPIEMPPKPTKVVKYLPPVAKPDDEVIDEEIVPTQDELTQATTSSVTIESTDTVIYEAEEAVEVVEEVQEPFSVVEKMPQFPGGDKKLLEFLSENIKYPRQALEMDIEGRVYIGFVVAPDGSIQNPEIIRGIGGGCDEEALKVVNEMPDWIPGQQAGRFVPVRYVLPVNFQISNY